MADEYYIETGNNLPAAQDYRALRQEGIRLIQQLSGSRWTDYNTHDPGITILEALCYAMTDLGYRSAYDIRDLLTREQENSTGSPLFQTARQALPTSPVTLFDFRKLLIDTEGVRNAWVRIARDYENLLYLHRPAAAEASGPALSIKPGPGATVIRLRGLYKVLVEYEEQINTGSEREAVNLVLRAKLNSHRNLGEDFLSIRPVEPALFPIEAALQVSESSDVEQINASVYQVIQNFFSPEIRFNTLSEMVDRGYTPEEIFDGPGLKFGFIDPREVEDDRDVKEIHFSDVVQLLLAIPGVIAVKKCLFPVQGKTGFADFNRWLQDVRANDKVPRLDLDRSVIEFNRSGDRHRTGEQQQPDRNCVLAAYSFLRAIKRQVRSRSVDNDFSLPVGRYLAAGDYHPFQKELPVMYGLQGNLRSGPGDSLSRSERQALQLGGYLLVFEQVMNDHLSRLKHLREAYDMNEEGPIQVSKLPDAGR